MNPPKFYVGIQRVGASHQCVLMVGRDSFPVFASGSAAQAAWIAARLEKAVAQIQSESQPEPLTCAVCGGYRKGVAVLCPCSCDSGPAPVRSDGADSKP